MGWGRRRYEPPSLTRRDFLGATIVASVIPQVLSANEKCATTPPSIEGPYWRPNAPFRTNLRGDDVDRKGETLIVSGRVTSNRDCQPIAAALLDVWQADENGEYDLDKKLDDTVFLLRGRLRTNERGEFRLETVRPAPYGVMGRQRPEHIHFKISAPGYSGVTTQLYFEGDPNLASDPLRAVRPALVRAVTRTSQGSLACNFDITLRKA